jgi:hypothetical protein
MDIQEPISAGGGSPSEVYLLFVLKLCQKYFDSVSTLDSKQIDASTAALISFVPDEKARVKFWEEYTKKKEELEYQGAGSVLSASVLSVGNVISYLSEVLEFTTKSYGGLL